MNKVTRLDSRRDAEAIEWAKELRETEAWFHSERFRDITRLHTPYEAVALRGSGPEDYALASHAAVKLYDYLQRLLKIKSKKLPTARFLQRAR